MSTHLKNHLIFYAVAVSSVLGLFRLTSAYGEANLNAPRNISGRYLTESAPPGCPPDLRLALTVQQSGTYLNGALSLEPPQAAVSEASPLPPSQFTLNGRWQQQVQLAGSTTAFADCQIPAVPVTLQGSISEAASPDKTTALDQSNLPDQPAHLTLTGELLFDQASPWQFVAKRQTVTSRKTEH